MRKRKIKFYFLLTTIVFLTSCTSIKVDPNDPDSHLIHGIKQIYQGPMQCGAASLTMVYKYYNVDASMTKIYQEIKGKGGGISCSALEGHASKLLKTGWDVASTADTIKEFISRDIPLIARVHSESRSGCHYVVIVGYTNKSFIIRDPAKGLRLESYHDFTKWHSCDYGDCGPYWSLAIYR
jgi:ABC-type bacteriocin/lantibiotic exporter with double-glycine peptidase domain